MVPSGATPDFFSRLFRTTDNRHSAAISIAKKRYYLKTFHVHLFTRLLFTKHSCSPIFCS
ncbi:hypothetical protein B5V00_00380 [Geothermobacter hydrogeniphilus]|uniref:Uncharacterized protein n=1 Tax=Geothermobacter hydrogeniphilus TaxID=1969733 RepID=A0A1X0YDS2_9BACT|nr:hypothetical protein B5V00_00380 [Geothermobacter hydrogeniphilus]